MLVYRLCNKEEIDKILCDKSFINIGKKMKIDKTKNTFMYKEDKRYIHFFRDFDSVFYLNTGIGHYICIYDIPKPLLNRSSGIGFYYDREFFRDINNVYEYGIDVDNIKFDYLVRVDKIIAYIDFDDCVNNSWTDKLEMIYLNNDIKDNKKLVLKDKR